ncbi:uncharacterized protein LOC129716982 [Wyeomyia smithii]|uniref:uncharacterized protein LOC129716982 n=1 Tax=Wyeomyia smithii TaxID=174621 RepID=UPI0024681DF1|nr:uncharacterized protein LOC129716982 [Wyeomyia smithii]
MPPTGGINQFPHINGQRPKVTGKFVVIESAEADRSLVETSAFLIEKTVESYCGEVTSIKKNKKRQNFRSNKVAASAENLKKLEKLGELKVRVFEHKTLNTCRVVVPCWEAINDPEEEIATKLKSQGMIGVKRIMRKTNGKLEKTSLLELTIDSPNAPTTIKIAYINVPTRPYYPRPRRCFKCLKYGHIAAGCPSEQLCWRCGEKSHDEGKCDRPEKCINCRSEQHASTSNKCPVWQNETATIKIQVDNKITFEEARKMANANRATNYADTLKKALNKTFKRN